MTKDWDLYFKRTDVPQGFSNSTFEELVGHPELVIRELIQNSLDATNEVREQACTEGRAGKIRFLITEIEKSEIPALESYERHFNKAKKHWLTRDEDEINVNDERIANAIEAAVKGPKTPALICVDNGIGLDAQRLDSLLSSGDSRKRNSGIGSFGNGHYAPFSISTLRYVLYGSRYYSEKGKLVDIASGNAILASSGTGNRIVSEKGFLARDKNKLFSKEPDPGAYLNRIPDVLLEYFADVPDTGTVICILGFKGFLKGTKSISSCAHIARAAAANFSDAIHNNLLEVSVKDDRDGRDEYIDVVPSKLEGILAPISTRSRGAILGGIKGEFAAAAEKTIRGGNLLPVNQEDLKGIEIRFRQLERKRDLDSQVHIFRKGMWIETGVSPLKDEDSDFSNCNPFDAVISLSDGPLEKLVSKSEPPRHTPIKLDNLTEKEKKDIRDTLLTVTRIIREEADKYPPKRDWAALFAASTKSVARLAFIILVFLWVRHNCF